jgi:hypothetical protein
MASDSKMVKLDVAADDDDLTLSHQVKDTEALVDRYKSLFKSDRFSDIVLQVKDDRYPAHRFVLMTASSVFE